MNHELSLFVEYIDGIEIARDAKYSRNTCSEKEREPKGNGIFKRVVFGLKPHKLSKEINEKDVIDQAQDEKDNRDNMVKTKPKQYW